MENSSKILALYQPLLRLLEQPRWRGWGQQLRQDLPSIFSSSRHGEWDRWEALLDRLPEASQLTMGLDRSVVTLGGDLAGQSREEFESLLRELHLSLIHI